MAGKKTIKTKPVKRVGTTNVIGNFKLPKSVANGLMKAAKAQGFTTFGIYAAG